MKAPAMKAPKKVDKAMKKGAVMKTVVKKKKTISTLAKSMAGTSKGKARALEEKAKVKALQEKMKAHADALQKKQEKAAALRAKQEAGAHPEEASRKEANWRKEVE